MLLQQLVNGLTLGSVYALIALGYTMVYGIIELINFAHGEIYMLGAYIGIITFSLLTTLQLTSPDSGVTLVCMMMAAIVFCGATGMTIERLAYRPLRTAPRLSPLISALGVSIFLQNFVMLAQGPRDKGFPELFIQGGIDLPGGRISAIQMFIMATSVLMMIGLHLLVRRTKIGKAMRATAQDKQMAELVGIDVNRVISVTFLIGSALAAIAGVMVGMYYGLINFSIGYIAGIKAFTAAVLGGIGSIPGAMLGGILLGLIESLGAGYISSEYKDVFAFAILILVLIFRPNGLLGANTSKRA
ncbi:branched-chain amino acid transporter permease subunit LivH [Candidatus Methylomirabilis lanthanidiphila]|uniref:Branched-chain amino acid transporter permease subunit LivH n=1 Tax=Candidatus Methylomirabilis lanthanidiphila TaxID=2211376 RepID=A0A564ZFQ2_9BACT|nr:branched-chain amino acid ABC transporter permease [Candidatus Methylomirabilis lanthanidiphila]VUZ83983.1 branched-chain amino acid transporter permease subunit LivH [Candidatus Methylomirabilis lanthanidiphila]